MKIVSWNANCKFMEKYTEIAKLGADIYVIQECENPDTTKNPANPLPSKNLIYQLSPQNQVDQPPLKNQVDQLFPQNSDYREFTKKGFWIGDIPFKGLMVFSPNPEIKLELLNWGTHHHRFFLPIKVNDRFTLIGCWACYPYIQEFRDFIHAAKPHLNQDTIIIGDLNSNTIFDKDNIKSGKTHSLIVEELRAIGLEDIYHIKSGDEQGKEKVPTFYLYRHLDKPYHLGHCFASPNMIKKMTIHARWQWLSMSDHLPIEIELPNSTRKSIR